MRARVIKCGLAERWKGSTANLAEHSLLTVQEREKEREGGGGVGVQKESLLLDLK